MILKNADDRSEDIAQLEVLREQSTPSFAREIQKQIRNIRAGAAGERNAAHFLNREFGDSEKMILLHDLRLGVDGDFAQIDHLLIHRFQRSAWVLETKNYAGRLNCDEHGDWTVWRSGKPTAIPSPVSQARRHCETLRLWLKANGYKPLHQIHPVVLISPTSSVNRTKLPAGSNVVKADNFRAWWEKQAEGIGLGTAFGMMGRHIVSGMSRDDLVAFGQELASAHVPAKYDWRAKLRLPQAAAPAEQVELTPDNCQTFPPGDADDAGRLTIATAHGKVTLTRIPDGRYALRNEKDDALIELVRNACKGKGRWNPRFRNWLIEAPELPSILALLEASQPQRPSD